MKTQYCKETEDACDSSTSMWKICKWSQNWTPRDSCTALQPYYLSARIMPRVQAQILIDRVFPPPPVVDLSDSLIITQVIILERLLWTKYTHSTILGSIWKKVSGEDSIPNLILKLIIDVLLPHLYRIFNACLDIGFRPTHFRASVTIVLRKPGRSDYTVAKAYRPIALFNNLGKSLEFILARRITYLAETYGFGPTITLVPGAQDLLNIYFTILYGRTQLSQLLCSDPNN